MDSLTEYHNLTQHQIRAMRTEYNLADAHTRQSQSSSQRKIIERLPELWYEAEKLPQHVLEERFINAFFYGQRQATAQQTPTMLVYSSSIAMVMVANLLARKNLKVSLIEPCFDNIYDILCNLNVAIDKPLSEEFLHDPYKIYENLTAHVNADALFIVEPNNPTGFTLEGDSQIVGERQASYRELIRYAKEHKKVLVFDFCFSPFLLQDAEPASFDVYKELEDSGVSYIIIEDTGKTWPLQDAKVALLKTSKDLHEEMRDIHTSYLLNVSPFILNLVTQYILDSEEDNFESLFGLLTRNRDIARSVLGGGLLEMQRSVANVSVAWFKITNPKVTATKLQEKAKEAGVYVLPGTYFFWSDHDKGEGFIRIALARDTDMFEEGVKKLKVVLDDISGTMA